MIASITIDTTNERQVELLAMLQAEERVWMALGQPLSLAVEEQWPSLDRRRTRDTVEIARDISSVRIMALQTQLHLEGARLDALPVVDVLRRG